MSPTPCSPPAALAAMRAGVRDLGETMWAARERHELLDVVSEAEALKASLDALLCPVVRELEATHAVSAEGWASTQDFLTHASGGHRGTGPALLRLAERTADPGLAPVLAAMTDGWLSTLQAQVIERAVDELPSSPEVRARGVAVLLEGARRLDATDLRHAARHLVSVVDPDGDERRVERELDREERAAHLRRHLSIRDDQAGGAWIRGRCSTEDAALVKSVLMPLAAPRPTGQTGCDPRTCAVPGCGHDGRDPRDHGARMLDALVDACRRLQTAEVLPDDHGAGARLTLTLDYEALRARIGTATTDTGEQLSASAVRRLACDAQVIPAVLGGPSEVLDVGRSQRLVTSAIWKAIVARDRHCRFPGCTRPPLMCHAHHVQHWVDGGPTSLANLVLLCSHHHRLVHAAPWHVRRAGAGRFDFRPPPRIDPGRVPGRPRRE